MRCGQAGRFSTRLEAAFPATFSHLPDDLIAQVAGAHTDIPLSFRAKHR
jgi:hypothetical protein